MEKPLKGQIDKWFKDEQSQRIVGYFGDVGYITSAAIRVAGDVVETINSRYVLGNPATKIEIQQLKDVIKENPLFALALNQSFQLQVEQNTPSDYKFRREDGMTLTREDVWGLCVETEDGLKRIHYGMVVADHNYGGRDKDCTSMLPCPIFGVRVPYKSVTIVCEPEQEAEVISWIAYVHGFEPEYSKELDDGRIAFHSSYNAW